MRGNIDILFSLFNGSSSVSMNIFRTVLSVARARWMWLHSAIRFFIWISCFPSVFLFYFFFGRIWLASIILHDFALIFFFFFLLFNLDKKIVRRGARSRNQNTFTRNRVGGNVITVFFRFSFTFHLDSTKYRNLNMQLKPTEKYLHFSKITSITCEKPFKNSNIFFMIYFFFSLKI